MTLWRQKYMAWTTHICITQIWGVQAMYFWRQTPEHERHTVEISEPEVTVLISAVCTFILLLYDTKVVHYVCISTLYGIFSSQHNPFMHLWIQQQNIQNSNL